MGIRFRLLSAVVAIGAAALAVPADTHACIHPGGGSQNVAIGQSGQQAIAFFHDGHQDLILHVEFEAQAAIESLGWVLPVPSPPDAYDTADPALFEKMAEWVSLERRTNRPQPRSRDVIAESAAVEPEAAIELLPPASAGPYEIQPIQARGADGVTGLRTWMEDNEFAPIPAEALGYYAERGWTFLAVKVAPPEGDDDLGEGGGLPPLRVSFATERLVYPLMLEAQGTFPVRLYVVTADALPLDAFAGSWSRGFHTAHAPDFTGHTENQAYYHVNVESFTAGDAPDELSALLADAERFPSDAELHLRVLHAPRFGAGAANPSGWDEELTVPGLGEGQRLMGGGTADPAEPVEAEPQEDEAEAEEEESADEPPAEDEAEPAAQADTDGDGGCDSCAATGASPAASWPLCLVLMLLVRRRR